MHGFPSGKEGLKEVSNIMGCMAPLEAVVQVKIWMIITSDAILRLKEPMQ